MRAERPEPAGASVSAQLRRALTVFLALAVVLVLSTAAVFTLLLAVVRPDLSRDLHQRAAVRTLHDGMLDEETGVRGWLATGDPAFLEPYHRGQQEVAHAGRQLRTARFVPLVTAATRWERSWAVAAVTGRSRAAGAPDVAFLRQGKERFDAYRTAEATALASMNARVDAAVQREDVALVVGLAAGLTVAAVLAVAVPRLRRRLRRTVLDPLAALHAAVADGSDVTLPDGTAADVADLAVAFAAARREAADAAAERAAAQDAVADSLRSTTSRLAAVVALQERLAGRDDVDDVMQTLAAGAQQLVRADAAVIEVVDGKQMRSVAATGTAANHVGMRLEIEGSMSGRCATTGQVQRCDDAREDPQVDLAACERLGALSLVCVPLTRGARTVAVVKVYSSALAAFEDDDVVALRLVAVSGAAALDRAEASAALARSEEWFRTVFAASPVAMLVTSADGEVLDGNDAASRLLERVDDPPVGISLATLAADGDDAQLRADLSALRAGGGVVRGERRFRAASGRVVWTHMAATAVDAVGNGRVVVQLEDIGERKRAEERLTALASTDALTGLPNRASLLRTVAAALTGGRDADARGVAVLFVDLDGFKAVNDGAGHDAGDAVLRKVARRLSHAVRPGDVVGRLGGDEFLVVCEAVTPAAAHTVAQRVERAAAEPVLVGGVAHRLGASVGVVVVEPGDRRNAADVVRAADAAMYRRKSHRRSTHRGVAATPQASRRVPHRVD